MVFFNTDWIDNIVSGDYMKYYNDMYSKITQGETAEQVAVVKEN